MSTHLGHPEPERKTGDGESHALVLAHGHVVVTHERPSGSRKKIKIPEVCIGVGVKFTNTFAMLRAEHARFVLQK